MQVQRVSDNDISFSAKFHKSFTNKLKQYARPYAIDFPKPDDITSSLIEERFGPNFGYDDVELIYKKVETYSDKREYRTKETIYAKKDNKTVKLICHYPSYDCDGHNIMRKLLSIPKHVFDLKMKELDDKVKGIKIKKTVKQKPRQKTEKIVEESSQKIEIKENSQKNLTPDSETSKPIDIPQINTTQPEIISNKSDKWWQFWKK